MRLETPVKVRQVLKVLCQIAVVQRASRQSQVAVRIPDQALNGRTVEERGIDEVVFDLRNTFDEWEKSIELLAAQVLPHFRGGR